MRHGESAREKFCFCLEGRPCGAGQLCVCVWVRLVSSGAPELERQRDEDCFNRSFRGSTKDTTLGAWPPLIGSAWS